MCTEVYQAKTGLGLLLYLVICIIVSIYKRTAMNGTSSRQILVHSLMSLANKYSCNSVVFTCSYCPKDKLKTTAGEEHAQTTSFLSEKIQLTVSLEQFRQRQRLNVTQNAQIVAGLKRNKIN